MNASEYILLSDEQMHQQCVDRFRIRLANEADKGRSLPQAAVDIGFDYPMYFVEITEALGDLGPIYEVPGDWMIGELQALADQGSCAARNMLAWSQIEL